MICLTAIERTFSVGDTAVHALRSVDLTIEAGEYVAVTGPSGSGKSTLLNIIGLLDRPDVGTYWLNGRDTTRVNERAQAALRRHYIGFVFQSFHLIPRLTAAQNVELPLTLAGIDPAERQDRVQATLAELGLGDRAQHRPEQLSGGQRQRVAIGRAIVNRPAIVLADEPTGNLDSAAGIDVIATLERLNRDGITLLLVTHDANLAVRARRRVEMVDGAILSDSG